MAGRERASPPRTPREQASEPCADGPSADAATLVRRMVGKPASEVLARLANGDPLKLYTLCARRIRETFFVLDPDRVFERALASIAVGIEIEGEACLRPEWLTSAMDRAIQATLDRDQEEERIGMPAENPEEHFRLFVEVFYVEPPLARLSSVRLNGLEERVRKGFRLMLVEGRTPEECMQLGLGPPERLQRDILAALEAIGLVDEPGVEALTRGDEQ